LPISSMKRKLMSYRCIIPIDGFYSWKKITKKAAIPYRFFQKNKGLMSMAGLWEEFEDEAEETHHTFSVITTQSNKQVLAVNERMPLLLSPQQEKLWLGKETSEIDLLKLVGSTPAIELESYTVSPKINSLAANESTLILPAAPADQFGNLTLFD
ncbi:MAG: SOS response-associated peptidase family protein, partial [Cyclobacteriaceae bacterium]